MKIAKFVTSKYAFPYPAGKVFAPYDVADQLTRGFLAQGHEVTWFAPKGTKTPATLVDCNFVAVNEDPRWETVPPGMKQEMTIWGDAVFLSHIAARAKEFDVIHLDSFLLALPFARVMPDTPVVFTLHNPLDVENIHANHDAHRDLKNIFFIAISEKQKEPLPDARWAATIYHGLEIESYPWKKEAGERWLFVSRILRSKGAHLAVQAAHQLGQPLDIIGPVYPNDQDYFDSEIKPYVDGEKIRYLGAKPHSELPPIYADAKGFIFPTQMSEAFGLVAIEALAAGTPVIASSNGAMPEVVNDGETGFLADSVDEIKAAMEKIDSISREHCRRVAEQRFSSDRVVAEYLTTFEKVLKEVATKS